MYYAHTKEDPQTEELLPEKDWQLLLSHLSGVAEKAERFASAFGGEEHANFIGLLHDIGKYADRFQLRLREGGHVMDHAAAGAVEINRLLQKPFGHLLAYCIAGHHSGLPDGGSAVDTVGEPTLCARLKKADMLEPYDAYKTEVTIPDPSKVKQLPLCPLGEQGFSVSFYLRMLYSCLVDADYLDTEYAIKGEVDRKIGSSIDALNQKLDVGLEKYLHPETDINRKRCETLKCCLSKAKLKPGLFSLTVPTGGGKTVSSLAFALRHAQQNELRRVIYVIPYNSIIEQNAAVFSDILGSDNVLEHHSNIDYDDSDNNDENARKKLATENWDMPVIVTTTVQFFESLFANRSSRCRKLHNIAESVIIFDEAQMFPKDYLLPCVRAISELVVNYRCSAVLCSATQPALDSFFPPPCKVIELCDHVPEYFHFFKRTVIKYTETLPDEELANRMSDLKQVLCIVNTRAQAQALFKLLGKQEGVFHLSTYMYSIHRRNKLKTIRQRLKDGLPCRLVSTSLVEAGVDIDCPVVYRGEAGLDSQVQAAGRCNREGKLPVSPVYIFPSDESYQSHIPSVLRRPIECARALIGKYDDPSSPEAVHEYFTRLFFYEGEGLDKKHIVQAFEDGLQEGLSFPFASVAEQFHLIDNPTQAILIPDTKEAQDLCRRLEYGECNRDLMRRIQQYAVNIYEKDYKALYDIRAIKLLDEEIAVLSDMSRYSQEVGLNVNIQGGKGIFC